MQMSNLLRLKTIRRLDRNICVLKIILFLHFLTYLAYLESFQLYLH